MSAKTKALSQLREAAIEYKYANQAVSATRQKLAQVCRYAYSDGANDREMSEAIQGTGLQISRARVQQFRKGDPRRKNA